MALTGTAFLPIWHDITPEFRGDFDRWHTHEHLTERLQTPGITVAKRYEKEGPGLHQYFVLYEAASFGVFESDGYFLTANSRSAWTQNVHPSFTNFVRFPCHLAMTRGQGLGGKVATIRVELNAPTDARFAAIDEFSLHVRGLIDSLMRQPLVIAAHAGFKGKVNRRPMNDASLSLRPGAADYDAVLIVEASHVAALSEAVANIITPLKKLTARIEHDVYSLVQFDCGT